jgi:hypothetical protein
LDSFQFGEVHFGDDNLVSFLEAGDDLDAIIARLANFNFPGDRL